MKCGDPTLNITNKCYTSYPVRSLEGGPRTQWKSKYLEKMGTSRKTLDDRVQIASISEIVQALKIRKTCQAHTLIGRREVPVLSTATLLFCLS